MDGGSSEEAGGGLVTGLGGLERWRANSQIAAWSLVLFGSVLLNATLLVAFIRRPGLRTISNRFVMNLIASNLLAIFVLSGLLIADSCGATTLPYSQSTASVCAISEGATALVTTSSILSVLLIGIDQYLAVVDPLRYRTRIDKLKCGLLILAVWIIALIFGTLASLNPQPRSLWRLCSQVQLTDDLNLNAPTELRFQASLLIDGDNATESADIEIEGEITFSNENIGDDFNVNATTVKNLTSKISNGYYFNGGFTYGLVYSIVYALFGYLIPFLAICWIYVSIYTAARNNSERTRRNGSRPILSSGSFSEEISNNGHRLPEGASSIEDFRRIPKISSLSSIDENSEISPSRERSQCPEDEEETTGDAANSVIFTLGSKKVDVSNKKEMTNIVENDNDDAKDSTKSKVPISALKAKFLSKRDSEDSVISAETLVKSRFPDVPDQRRKSSHDLMYEEMMIGCNGKHPYEYDDDDLDSDDDDDDDDDLPRNYEEALPLSQAIKVDTNTQGSTRSISVNFDLSEQPAEHSKMLDKQNNGVTNQPPPIVTITPPGHKISTSTTLHRVPSVKSTNSYITNLKYRISNGSLFKYREETRAARVSALVVVMGLICWTPYVYLLVQRNLSTSFEDSISLNTTALGFLVLATYISPLLFGYRSRRVKRELKKFFCFKRELSYKNNRSLMAKKVLRRRHSGATILGQFEAQLEGSRYNIFNCIHGKNRWPKEKVQFVQVPETALAVETCRSSFSSGASTQISSTSTDEC